jgi:hypothetical protein
MEDEHRKAVIKGLEEELCRQEDMLRAADEELKVAQAKFDVASRKYAAIRDTLTKYLGYSPYNKEHGEVIEPVWNEDEIIDVVSYGKYRFIHMTIGNAVVAALMEAGEPLALEEVVKKLREGGIRKSESTLTRAVNAALMRTKGVQKNRAGKYSYTKEFEPKIKPEDLPF